MDKDLDKHFTEDDKTMTNKHMKRCSTSLIKEIPIKAYFDTTTHPSEWLK